MTVEVDVCSRMSSRQHKMLHLQMMHFNYAVMNELVRFLSLNRKFLVAAITYDQE